MSQIYSDPVIQLLITRLNSDGPAQLRNRYFQGDPLILPKSAMPICFISRDDTNMSIETTDEDRHDMNLVLNVVTDFARDINQKSFVQAGTTELYRLVEGRDTDMTLLSDTIAHVLRSNQVLDSVNKLYIDVGNSLNIDYVVSPPSRRGLWSVEAVIRITIRHSEIRA